MEEMKLYKACENLLTTCSHCKPEEKILIVTKTIVLNGLSVKK